MNRCFALLLAFLAFLPPMAHAGTSVTACYEDKGWDNYVLGEGTNIPEQPGILIELVQSAIKQQDLTLELIRRPWKRCLLMLREAAVDFVISGSYLPARAVYAQYPTKPDVTPDQTRALHFANYYLYTRPDSPLKWDGEKLEGHSKPLGVSLGYSIGRILKAQGYEIKEFSELEAGLKLVDRNRLDGYVTFETDAQPLLDKRELNIVQVYPPIRSRAYYLMIGKAFYQQHTQRSEMIWNELASLRRQLLPKLVDKYRNLNPS